MHLLRPARLNHSCGLMYLPPQWVDVSAALPVSACPCLQVSRILFEKLQLPPPPVAKDLKSGGFSTGQEVGWGAGQVEHIWRGCTPAQRLHPFAPLLHVSWLVSYLACSRRACNT